MSVITLVPETTLTLEIEDFKFQIYHHEAYALMLFCLTDSLDGDKTNVFNLSFVSPTSPSNNPMSDIGDYIKVEGCAVYAERYEDTLRFSLWDKKEYIAQRSDVLWILYYKLNECYGDVINFPEMDESGEFSGGYRVWHDALLNKDARLYPIVENGRRITTFENGKTLWLYMCIKPGSYTKIVWVDDDDDTKPVSDYKVWDSSGSFLSYGNMECNGKDYCLHYQQPTRLYMHELLKKDCFIKVFKDLASSPISIEL